MKTLHATLFILFFITCSTNVSAQSYKIDSIFRGSDFNEYSHSSQDYFEGLIDAISEFTIDISEGDLAIVSMEKSDWKLMFRFYRSASMLKMSQEEYRKTNEFYCTSDIINGINYLEMSVERESEEISSGEISFYPDRGLYKSIFTVKFSRKNNENAPHSENLNNNHTEKKATNVYIERQKKLEQERSYRLFYTLNNRLAVYLERPKIEALKEGIIVVKITVDKHGKVTSAKSGVDGTTITDDKFLEAAKKAALKVKFNADEEAPAFQQGTITYFFDAN